MRRQDLYLARRRGLLRRSGSAAGGGGGGATVYTDTFNRPNQAGLGAFSDGSGKTWLLDPELQTMPEPPVTDGGWCITDNEATLNFLSGGAQIAYVAFGTTGRAKITMSAAAGMGMPYGIVARRLDNSNYFRMAIAEGGSGFTIDLFKLVAGVQSASLIALNYEFDLPSAGDTFELGVTSGNVWTIYRDGVVQGTVTDSDLSTRTGWGMYVDGSGAELSPWPGSIDRFDFTPA